MCSLQAGAANNSCSFLAHSFVLSLTAHAFWIKLFVPRNQHLEGSQSKCLSVFSNVSHVIDFHCPRSETQSFLGIFYLFPRDRFCIFDAIENRNIKPNISLILSVLACSPLFCTVSDTLLFFLAFSIRHKMQNTEAIISCFWRTLFWHSPCLTHQDFVKNCSPPDSFMFPDYKSPFSEHLWHNNTFMSRTRMATFLCKELQMSDSIIGSYGNFSKKA